MIPRRTTPTPNRLYDELLPELTESELKVLLVVIRQTYGWKSKGGRKQRDRISVGFFRVKTGLSRRAISRAIDNLVTRGFVVARTRTGQLLPSKESRRGKKGIFYSCCLQHGSFVPQTRVNGSHVPVTNGHITKETHLKETPNKTSGSGKPNKKDKGVDRVKNSQRLTDMERYREIMGQNGL